jgi:hypothetical protein
MQLDETERAHLANIAQTRIRMSVDTIQEQP